MQITVYATFERYFDTASVRVISLSLQFSRIKSDAIRYNCEYEKSEVTIDRTLTYLSLFTVFLLFLFSF
jgi:hypothetical protein